MHDENGLARTFSTFFPVADSGDYAPLQQAIQPLQGLFSHFLRPPVRHIRPAAGDAAALAGAKLLFGGHPRPLYSPPADVFKPTPDALGAA